MRRVMRRALTAKLSPPSTRPWSTASAFWPASKRAMRTAVAGTSSGSGGPPLSARRRRNVASTERRSSPMIGMAYQSESPPHATNLWCLRVFRQLRCERADQRFFRKWNRGVGCVVVLKLVVQLGAGREHAAQRDL